MRRFGHFDLKIRFVRQRRAIFHFSAEQLPQRPGPSKPTFRPSGTTNHGTNAAICDFPYTSRACIFLS